LSGANDPGFLTELFAGFGPVAVRRMFSGVAVFADGLMIALVVDGVIYSKRTTAWSRCSSGKAKRHSATRPGTASAR